MSDRTASRFPTLRALFARFRHAADSGELDPAVDELVGRLQGDREFADPVRVEVRRLLAETDSTYLLTVAGILSDEA